MVRAPRGPIDAALALLHEALARPDRAALVAQELGSVLSRIRPWRQRVHLEGVMHDILAASQSPAELDRIRARLERWQDHNGYRPR